jgi:hypothetical protein
MESTDLKSDEITYAIESVSLGRVGMTRWNGGPFFVHPPLFFLVEGLYYKLVGVGNGPLFTRLIDGPYTAGEALLPPDVQPGADTMPNAIRLARYLNALYGGILAALVFLLGSLLLNRKLGLFAAALFMLDPYVVWRNHFNYLEGLTIIFGVLALYFYYKAEQRANNSNRRRGLITAGVCLGLSLLTKELALLFALAILTYWLIFRRTRFGETALTIGIGLALYSLFPLWATINDGLQNWWDTRNWLFKRLAGQIQDSGIATDKPGTSLLDTIGVNLPDYWPWFVMLGITLLLAVGFLYLYVRRGLRDRAGEFLTACVIGTYGFFVIIKLVGGVINEHFFYYLMPIAILMPAYIALSWSRLQASLNSSPNITGSGTPVTGTASEATMPYGPDTPTIPVALAISTPSWTSRVGRGLLVLLLVLVAYNAVMWIVRYGFGVDNSYVSVDSRLGGTLPAGTPVVGRDLLDLYLMPKQAVYTFSYLNLIGRNIDPANVRDRSIPYALLNDQSVQERYGGANPTYYQWVYSNGDQIEKFTGRLYNTYVYHLDYSRPEAPYNGDSISAHRPVVASSVEDPRYFAPENAVDTKITTRWASNETDNEWIYVDLGKSTGVSKVLLSWEDAYARSYQLQVSDDAQNWSTFYTSDHGAGGLETIDAKATGRYVRVLMTKRGTKYGYSLWELSVYP